MCFVHLAQKQKHQTNALMPDLAFCGPKHLIPCGLNHTNVVLMIPFIADQGTKP
jgi:hypothetical protein